MSGGSTLCSAGTDRVDSFAHLHDHLARQNRDSTICITEALIFVSNDLRELLQSFFELPPAVLRSLALWNLERN